VPVLRACATINRILLGSNRKQATTHPFIYHLAYWASMYALHVLATVNDAKLRSHNILTGVLVRIQVTATGVVVGATTCAMLMMR